MPTALLASTIVLSVMVLGFGFLVIGALRALGLLTWRLDQMEAITPRRTGREGLKIGKRASPVTLPSVAQEEVSLSDFAGRKVLLVFTQSGCGPCHEIAPELNRIHDQRECQVLVVNNGDPDETRQWADEIRARFPVLVQENFSLSKRYEVFATPFAFLIDEQGIIASKGIVGSRQYLNYVLTGAGNRAANDHAESAWEKAEQHDIQGPIKGAFHV
jgi:methylamine dehydrogenase accessory protein MauD